MPKNLSLVPAAEAKTEAQLPALIERPHALKGPFARKFHKMNHESLRQLKALKATNTKSAQISSGVAHWLEQCCTDALEYVGTAYVEQIKVPSFNGIPHIDQMIAVLDNAKFMLMDIREKQRFIDKSSPEA